MEGEEHYSGSCNSQEVDADDDIPASNESVSDSDLPEPETYAAIRISDDDSEEVLFIAASLCCLLRMLSNVVRGCRKSYHPECIGLRWRSLDPAASWTCVRHKCRNCEKDTEYMCYTCPYSSCTDCIRDANFFRVRSNMGFCGRCMENVIRIANNYQGRVDYCDEYNWEDDFNFKG